MNLVKLTPAACAELCQDVLTERIDYNLSGSNDRRLGRFGIDWNIRESSEKATKLAQKLGQLQPFIAVFRQECMGQLASFGPT